MRNHGDRAAGPFTVRLTDDGAVVGERVVQGLAADGTTAVGFD